MAGDLDILLNKLDEKCAVMEKQLEEVKRNNQEGGNKPQPILPRWNLQEITEELEEVKKEQNRCKTFYERLCSSVEAAENSNDPRFAVLKQQADSQKECWSYYVNREKILERVRSALEIIEDMIEGAESNNASEYFSEGYDGKDPRLIMLEWNAKIIPEKLESKRKELHISKNCLELFTAKYESMKGSIDSGKREESMEEERDIKDLIVEERHKIHILEYEVDVLEAYHFVLKKEIRFFADFDRNSFIKSREWDNYVKLVVRPVSDSKKNKVSIPGALTYNFFREQLSEQADKIKLLEAELSLGESHNIDGIGVRALQEVKRNETYIPKTDRAFRKLLAEQENKIRSLASKMR